MREKIRGVGFCLMMATMLHSIATGNLLPAWVKVACVDINPATVTKLTDRGSIQTVGVVTDAEPFLRSLVRSWGGEPRNPAQVLASGRASVNAVRPHEVDKLRHSPCPMASATRRSHMRSRVS